MKKKFKREVGVKSVRKTRNKRTEDLQDQFHCLPDDLLLSIFSTLSDLKSLCQCSLVCKRFASVVSNVRAVSVTLPSNGTHSAESYKNICAIFPEMDGLGDDELSSFHALLSLKLPILMHKFRDLESVDVEYKCPIKPVNAPFLKWKVKCRSDSPMIESFVALLPSSMCTKGEYDPNAEQGSSLEFISNQMKDCLWLSYGRYIEWLCLASIIRKDHDSLRSVTVTDSEKQGKLVVRDKQIFTMKGCLLEKEIAVPHLQPIFEVAWVPVLHLPSSGYVMTNVCLIVVEIPTESHNTGSKDNGESGMRAWEFEEDEKVFGEAIREITKNHKDKFVLMD